MNPLREGMRRCHNGNNGDEHGLSSIAQRTIVEMRDCEFLGSERIHA